MPRFSNGPVNGTEERLEALLHSQEETNDLLRSILNKDVGVDIQPPMVKLKEPEKFEPEPLPKKLTDRLRRR